MYIVCTTSGNDKSLMRAVPRRDHSSPPFLNPICLLGFLTFPPSPIDEVLYAHQTAKSIHTKYQKKKSNEIEMTCIT